MANNTRKYVDYDGLRLYHDLSKTETENAIEIAGQTLDTKINLVDAKYEEILNDAIIYKPVYYALDAQGNKIPVYTPAEGTAKTGVTYYERTGTGSTSNPYVYTVKQVAVGDPVEGLYTKSNEFEVTLVETSEPVMIWNEETQQYEQKYVEVTVIDGTATIMDAEIKDLFENLGA